ncbi:MAG: hypothetical protein KAJ14_13335, partial [Candidatus Omnitrophica bacterium]|nr:hypothetical protein [Candidatus Omnitrophota bacterium]
ALASYISAIFITNNLTATICADKKRDYFVGTYANAANVSEDGGSFKDDVRTLKRDISTIAFDPLREKLSKELSYLIKRRALLTLSYRKKKRENKEKVVYSLSKKLAKRIKQAVRMIELIEEFNKMKKDLIRELEAIDFQFEKIKQPVLLTQEFFNEKVTHLDCIEAELKEIKEENPDFIFDEKLFKEIAEFNDSIRDLGLRRHSLFKLIRDASSILAEYGKDWDDSDVIENIEDHLKRIALKGIDGFRNKVRAYLLNPLESKLAKSVMKEERRIEEEERSDTEVDERDTLMSEEGLIMPDETDTEKSVNSLLQEEPKKSVYVKSEAITPKELSPEQPKEIIVLLAPQNKEEMKTPKGKVKERKLAERNNPLSKLLEPRKYFKFVDWVRRKSYEKSYLEEKYNKHVNELQEWPEEMTEEDYELRPEQILPYAQLVYESNDGRTGSKRCIVYVRDYNGFYFDEIIVLGRTNGNNRIITFYRSKGDLSNLKRLINGTKGKCYLFDNFSFNQQILVLDKNKIIKVKDKAYLARILKERSKLPLTEKDKVDKWLDEVIKELEQKDNNDYPKVKSDYNDIHKGKLKDSLEYNNILAQIFEGLEQCDFLLKVRIRNAITSSKLKDIKKQIYYNELIVDLSEKVGDKEALFQALEVLSDLYMKSGELGKSAGCKEKVGDLLKKQGDTKGAYQWYRWAFQMYRNKVGNTKAAGRCSSKASESRNSFDSTVRRDGGGDSLSLPLKVRLPESIIKQLKIMGNLEMMIKAIIMDIDKTVTASGTANLEGLNLKQIVHVLEMGIPILLISGSPFHGKESFTTYSQSIKREKYFDYTGEDLETRVAEVMQEEMIKRGKAHCLVNLTIKGISGAQTIIFNKDGTFQLDSKETQAKSLNLKEQIDFIKAMVTGYLMQLSEEKMLGSEVQEINFVIEEINKAENVLEVKEIFENFVEQKTGAHVWLFDSEFALIFHNVEINAKEAFKKSLQILKTKGYSFENEPCFASFGDNFVKISLYNKAVE